MRDVLAGRRRVAEDGMPVVSTTLPREAESVPVARRFVRATLVDWKLPSLTDVAELVVSELASNAVLHARHQSFRLTVRRLDEDQVRVAVIDRSRVEPTVATPDDEDDHGRGLALVDAVAERWGTDPMPWGKRVWADLQAPAPAPAPAPNVPMYLTGRAQIVYALIVAGLITSLAVQR